MVAGAGQKLIGFFNDSVNAAKDLGESLNAVNKIFGSSSQQILDWGKNNANQFGLSQRAFNQLVVPLGAGLRNSGIAMDQVASKSIQLTERAADMASVFNTDVSEALEAIQAGLRGEADPLERFGVGLSAAKVESMALSMTGKTLASTLTEEEKALARVELILQQTNTSAGDFGATSDELANKTRIQQARQEELAATLGQKLLPVQLAITDAKLALVDALVTKVIPTLEALYQQHWPALSVQLDSFVKSAENVGTAVIALNDLYGALIGVLQDFGIETDKNSAAISVLMFAFTSALLPIQKIIDGIQLVADVVRIAESAVRSLSNAIRSIPSLPSLPSVPDLNPFRAAGGPVSAGSSYVVGERGPELFVPQQSGAIMPNGAAGSGVSVAFNGPVTINARDKAEAEVSGGLAGWGIMAAMRSRGIA